MPPNVAQTLFWIFYLVHLDNADYGYQRFSRGIMTQLTRLYGCLELVEVQASWHAHHGYKRNHSKILKPWIGAVPNHE